MDKMDKNYPRIIPLIKYTGHQNCPFNKKYPSNK